jgi:2-oxoglutarate dehydrogenase complex dehydrogenase (E1) component-like enzyme
MEQKFWSCLYIVVIGPHAWQQMLLIKLLIRNSVFSYAGRPCAASPATGSKVQHYKEQNQMMEDAMALWI